LLECAKELGVPVNEAPLPLDTPMDELYLSSSLKVLCPVDTLDDKPAPGEGPVGQGLRKAFWSTMLRN
jgi:branched-subunit amino acid aminotransferase/4-amino-4-deoxychorismate lyase